MIISGLSAIVVSIVLMLWILKMKKDNPFPKLTIIKVLVGGWLSYSISGAVTLALAFAVPILRFGFTDCIAAWPDALSDTLSCKKSLFISRTIFRCIRTVISG